LLRRQLHALDLYPIGVAASARQGRDSLLELIDPQLNRVALLARGLRDLLLLFRRQFDSKLPFVAIVDVLSLWAKTSARGTFDRVHDRYAS
jgi:hypothetical protein